MEQGCGGYCPYFDPDYECLTEKINPPSVCVDNETCADCTLVKVDSANKHGILLEMVQVLTDLDLVISKSYISSDGGWFMDVFHVTDQFGRKLSDRSLISYIQQSLFSRRLRSGLQPVKTCLGRVVDPKEATAASPSEGYTALELTVTDGPGLLSELCAVVSAFDCVVVSAQAWTRHCRGACILYVADRPIGGPVPDGNRLTELESKLEQVMAAHHCSGQRWRLGLRNVVPAESQVQTERRLHQLMHDDGDGDILEDEDGTGKNRVAKLEMGTVVSIDSCLEKGYSVVSIRSRDRPKLLFDTVCTLTDMNYVVSHATISSRGAIASQEYFIRRMDGLPLKSEAEKRRVARCLVAAIERRVSHGLRLNVCTPNGLGLLCDVTRAFREYGLSVTGAEVGTRDNQAMGTFYVTDASGEEVNLGSVNKVREQVGRTMAVEVGDSPTWPMVKTRSEPAAATPGQNEEERAKSSLGSVFWSRLVRLSHFGSIRS